MDRCSDIGLRADSSGSIRAAHHVSSNGDAGASVHARCRVAVLFGNRPPSRRADADGLTSDEWRALDRGKETSI